MLHPHIKSAPKSSSCIHKLQFLSITNHILTHPSPITLMYTNLSLHIRVCVSIYEEASSRMDIHTHSKKDTATKHRRYPPLRCQALGSPATAPNVKPSPTPLPLRRRSGCGRYAYPFSSLLHPLMQEGYASKRIIARTCARPWVSIHTNTHTHDKRVTLEREKKKKKVCHSPFRLRSPPDTLRLPSASWAPFSSQST